MADKPRSPRRTAALALLLAAAFALAPAAAPAASPVPTETPPAEGLAPVPAETPPAEGLAPVPEETPGTTEAPAPEDAETLTLREKLDSAFQRFDTMGASVAVFQNGKVTFTHTFGMAVKAEKGAEGEPVTADTLFQVGSISKMVAGIGLLQLAGQGKVSLDGDLGEALGFPLRNPQYPDAPITLRQLMTHTAGLRDSGAYNRAIQGKPEPLSQLFGGARARTLFLSKTPPGSVSAYSNFGGGLAGSLIEALSGQTLDGYLKANVFDPLGITAAYQAGLLPEGVRPASLYDMPSRRLTRAPGEAETAYALPDPERHYYLTAGKLLISAPDLAKILIALCDGGIYEGARILERALALEMRTPQSGRGSVTGQSSWGLFLNIVTDDVTEGRTLYGHGGKAYGMLCAAYFDPVERTGVVMLTNGCNNRRAYHGVGLLSRTVVSLCYEEWLDLRHKPTSPWLVREDE